MEDDDIIAISTKDIAYIQDVFNAGLHLYHAYEYSILFR